LPNIGFVGVAQYVRVEVITHQVCDLFNLIGRTRQLRKFGTDVAVHSHADEHAFCPHALHPVMMDQSQLSVVRPRRGPYRRTYPDPRA